MRSILDMTPLAVVGVALVGLTPNHGVLAASELRFREISQQVGLDFRHHHGGSGERYMVETMVGGVVVLDYDYDGDPDVLFVDGGSLPGYEGEAPRTRLYRNDGGRFVDVTDRSGLDFDGYGCGAAAGDYDGDGDLDLYFTAFGRNALYRNLGDGTFARVADAAGAQTERWSSSAAFADVDRDGDLDLFLGNYVDFSLDNHKFCGDKTRGIRGYCHPDVYEGEQDQLFRNDGGRFSDVTEEAGLGSSREATLGSLFADLDGDRFPDLYVANDLDPNLLFRNRGDGTFEDLSLLAGTGYSNTGKPEAGMGVEAADFDNDGLLDLFVTNFALETNALYRNSGNLLFVDHRFVANVAEPSYRYLGFGVGAGDFDHDGDVDLVIANGHILDNAEELSATKLYAQPNQLMENLGGGKFVERGNVGLDQVRVSRGLAMGDLDLDGDLDFVVLNSNQDAEVYDNLGGVPSPWLEVSLLSERSNRRGVGTRLELDSGGRRQVRELRSSSSYLSQHSMVAHFGLADAEISTLTLRWPSGATTRIERIPPATRVRVAEP